MRRAESGSLQPLPVSVPVPPAPDALSVLVVEPSLEALVVVTTTLTTAGFRVTAAESFVQAKPILLSQPPTILVTAVRLGAYNGLHLVLRAKSVRPEIAALVTSPENDAVLRADAEEMGATFVVTPLPEKDLIAAVLQTLFRSDPAGSPIRPPFERRLGERRAGSETFSDERRSADRRRLLPWMASESLEYPGY
jgi:DNA-binding response OmpR family regulator